MEKEKNVDYYRNVLHKDSITILVLSLITAILLILLGDDNFGDAEVVMFFKSILFIIFSIILFRNTKENSLFIGRFSIVTGGMMMITSFRGGSVFDIVYLLFGFFSIIHAIIYLVKLRQASTFLAQSFPKKSKFVYMNLGLLILAILSLIANGFALRNSSTSVMWFGIVTLALLLFTFVFSIILIKKKYKSVILYLTFMATIICAFWSITINIYI